MWVVVDLHSELVSSCHVLLVEIGVAIEPKSRSLDVGFVKQGGTCGVSDGVCSLYSDSAVFTVVLSNFAHADGLVCCRGQ